MASWALEGTRARSFRAGCAWAARQEVESVPWPGGCADVGWFSFFVEPVLISSPPFTFALPEK